METKVQSQPKKPIAQSVLRSLFPVLGTVAPNYSARLFFKLFTTPRKVSLKPPHEALLAASEQFSFFIKDPWGYHDRVEIQGYTWNPDGDRTVLLVHGWNGKAADYYKLVPVLVEAGYRVDAIDCKAHGASESTRSSMVDFMESIQGYLQLKGVPFCLIGHSLGGSASTFLMVREKIPLQKLVLLANPVVMLHAFELGFELMNLTEKTRALVIEQSEKLLGRKISDFDLRTVNLDHIHQILELYVDDDEEIPNNDTMQFLQTHPSIQSVKIENCGHNYIKRDKKAIQAIVQFLRN
jgi:esterase/lipase